MCGKCNEPRIDCEVHRNELVLGTGTACHVVVCTRSALLLALTVCRTDKTAGHLVTFSQFLFIAAEGLVATGLQWVWVGGAL
jgi:hypothetical protein